MTIEGWTRVLLFTTVVLATGLMIGGITLIVSIFNGSSR